MQLVTLFSRQILSCSTINKISAYFLFNEPSLKILELQKYSSTTFLVII